MARNNGLDTPRETRRSLRANYDPETFGRLSERFARFLGTARFLVYMTAFVITWISWNTLAPENLRWDKYPFIFLTLILSLQASYAAPLILLAHNRQADRDRAGTRGHASSAHLQDAAAPPHDAGGARQDPGPLAQRRSYPPAARGAIQPKPRDDLAGYRW